jgi:UDP-2,3-diacylglucosamine hydrolase
MPFSILASDFHLTPDDPAGLATFHAFLKDVVAGAERFYLIGDIFETWVGKKHLRWPEYRAVFDALSTLSASGTEVVLFHGNRDFLLGKAEAAACGGRVVGEESEFTLHGRRCLLLHGDSLCTNDVGYQKTKPILRSGFVRFLTHVLPFGLQLRIARKLRGTSKRSVAMKATAQMEIVPDSVRLRYAEGYEVMICGHVHRPGVRHYEAVPGDRPLHVLGAWDGGGVFARADESGVALLEYREGKVAPFPDVARVG